MRNINISLRQMRAVTALAQHNSFRRAADSLNLSQSALSTAIQQVELELAVSLFDRTTRRVELTSVGRNLLPSFERILSEVELVLDDARGEAAGTRGRVVVTAPLSVVVGVLPSVVRRFSLKYPNVKIVLLDQTVSESYRSLHRTEADLGICGQGDLERDLEFEFLASDRFNAILPIDHPRASQTEVRWRDLLRHPLVAMTPGTQIRDQMENALHRHKLALRPVCEVSGPMAVEAMVAAKLGVGALPIIDPRPHYDQVCYRPLVEPVLERHTGVVWRQGHSLSPAAAAFREELAAYFRELKRNA